MLFDKEKTKKPSRYLTYLSFKISNPEIDLWADAAFRAKSLAEDPERFKEVKSWKEVRSYVYHMAFYTNGKSTSLLLAFYLSVFSIF